MDIVIEGFLIRLTLCRGTVSTGNRDSSVHNNNITSVNYGRFVETIECANQVVKCSRLANIVKDNQRYGGTGKLTQGVIKKLSV